MAVKLLANSFAALELDVEDENGNSSVVGVSAAPNFVKNSNRALKLGYLEYLFIPFCGASGFLFI